MGDELDLSFQKASDGVQRWGGRVELCKVKFDVDDYFEWLGLRKAESFSSSLDSVAIFE